MRIHRHRRFQPPKFAAPVYKANRAISAEQVRVIGEEGEPLGVMTTAEALALAESRGLDIIEVSPKAEPPVCRLGDYGQFKYQKEKEARKQRAQSKEVDIKGIRLTPRIGPGDFQMRVDQGKKFLEQGDKVKAEMMLRGRERAHVEVAKEVFEKYAAALEAAFPLTIEQPFRALNGRLSMILARK